MPSQSAPALERLLVSFPPKAAQLIVTIYGDIVEPRGGILWMGDLITLCARFGVNESLVRTAVSRLVSRNQLSGERVGRRSYYGLTPSAGLEFHSAAELFFGAADGDCSLVFVYQEDETQQKDLTRQGFASAGPNLMVGADRAGRVISGARFDVSEFIGGEGLESRRAYMERLFDLQTLHEQYESFLRRFLGLKDCSLAGLGGEEALTLRLALVHSYRAVRFVDPRLPVSLLPVDWPGKRARDLFADAYDRLSKVADPYIGTHLQGRDGFLEPLPAAVLDRLKSMRS